MKNRICKHISADGKQCGGFAMNGSDFCFFHDPATADARREAGRKGGSRSKIASTKVLPEDTPDIKIESIKDIETLIAATISQVRRGDLAPSVSNAVCQLINAWTKILEIGELEERMRRLEAAVETDSAKQFRRVG